MEATLRWRRVTVAVAGAGAAAVAAAASPSVQDRRHFDHVAFLEAVRQIRDGEGLYEAFVGGMRSIGASVDQVRGIRQPWVLGLWSLLSDDALRWAFFAVVVFGGGLVASRLTRVPEIGLAVGAWAAIAGVYGGVDAWLLYELWTVPLVLGCCLAWVRGLDGVAAVCALAVVLLRETAVLLPLGFLAAAWWLRRPVLPWLLSLGGTTIALALHWSAAEPHLDPEGRSAILSGTGGLRAVADMTGYLVMPDAIGLVVWAVGLVLLWRSALRPAMPLALVPLFGLYVDRPYWGFLAMPLCITALGGLPPWTGRGPCRAPLGRQDPEATTELAAPRSTPPSPS